MSDLRPQPVMGHGATRVVWRADKHLMAVTRDGKVTVAKAQKRARKTGTRTTVTGKGSQVKLGKTIACEVVVK